MSGILIVDDDQRDAEITKSAISTALQALGKTGIEIKLARNIGEGLEQLKKDRPRLVITDLFMPPEGTLEDLAVRCDEMEFPHGFRLLKECRNYVHNTRRLVNTLYWNYPGFGRYADIIAKLADGALPKDIFYAVGTLRNPDAIELKDFEAFPPMRILVLVLDILLADAPSKHFRLHIQSLYEEASAYLRSLPNAAAEIRQQVFEASVRRAQPKASKSRAEEKTWSADDLAQQLAAGPWLPTFAIVSQEADYAQAENGYTVMMKAIAETQGWHVDIRTPHCLPRKDAICYIESDWQDVRSYIPYGSQNPRPIESRPFLSPKTRKLNDLEDGDRPLAQLLLTLGFFTNWCHIRTHEMVLTAKQIAEIILRRTESHYRGDERRATDRIREDLETLDWLATREIMRYPRDWYQYFKVGRVPVIGVSRVGTSRSDTNYRFKLNGSVRLFSNDRVARPFDLV